MTAVPAIAPHRHVPVVIVGGGPAGLAIARTLQRAGVGHVVLERGPIAAHIAQYPHFMRFFSTNANLEIDGFPLGITEEKPSRAEYLRYLTQFVRYHRLPVETFSPVVAVERQADGGFHVVVERAGARREVIAARAVVVAVGAWERPRRLGVPGDELPKVHYRYTEPHEYVGRRVLVVGGRNSAVETALQLWRAGARVALSYRRTEFNGRGLKYWLRPDIENRLAAGEIEGHLGTTVRAIGWDWVELQDGAGGVVRLENDVVLPMLGYDPPVEFLAGLGIAIEPVTNRPAHDPATLESNVPGLFIGGVITAGNVSGHVFIENSRHHGELMLPRLRALVGG
jgi:thioredoxin reductase (NADPH)